jgi:hypothetical protein
VSVNGVPLQTRPDLRPGTIADFFECGYVGAGPQLLALAILADFLHNDRIAIEKSTAFERNVISHLPKDRSWALTSRDVADALVLLGS